MGGESERKPARMQLLELERGKPFSEIIRELVATGLDKEGVAIELGISRRTLDTYCLLSGCNIRRVPAVVEA
jgi:hypothetical protein